jgi:hypothetical protein
MQAIAGIAAAKGSGGRAVPARDRGDHAGEAAWSSFSTRHMIVFVQQPAAGSCVPQQQSGSVGVEENRPEETGSVPQKCVTTVKPVVTARYRQRKAMCITVFTN